MGSSSGGSSSGGSNSSSGSLSISNLNLGQTSGSSQNTGFALTTNNGFGSTTNSSNTGTTGAVSNTNFLGGNYANPLVGGLSGISGSGQFGKALYTLTTSSNTLGLSGSMTALKVGGTSSMMGSSNNRMGGTTSGGLGSNSGTSTTGTMYPLNRVPVSSSPQQLVNARQIRPDLAQALASVSLERLPSRDNVQILTDGQNIRLQGKVTSDYERRMTEAVLRLSPGVREVDNRLEVAP